MVARPFWILGHNTNTLGEVNAALQQGANALEIDVHDTPEGRWVVSHDSPRPNAPELGAFLRDVSNIARQNPRLCLVTLDCKTFSPALADTLLSIARFNWADMSGGPFLRPFIISVPHLGNAPFFRPILNELREFEGLMIDEENNPDQVVAALRGARNACFGDGITALLPGPHVRPAIEHAVALKASDQRVKFAYSWTYTQISSLAEQVDIGVDGVITDNVPGLLALLNGRFATVARLATAQDNPFSQAVPAYGLAVFTGPDMAGDGNIEFTLRGDVGTATRVVNGSLSRRFDALSTTFVTLLGQEVGTPQAISVRCLEHPWALDSIQLLGPGPLRIARFERRIPAGGSAEVPLGA